MVGSGKCGDPCSPLRAEQKRGQALRSLAGRTMDSREGQLGKVYGELKVGYSRLASILLVLSHSESQQVIETPVSHLQNEGI